jgi:hypothetical protein
MRAMTVGEWEALPYQCARNLPSCRGEVRLYRQPLRPATEVHRLCRGCRADLAAPPLRLTFIDIDQPNYQPSVIRFVPFGGAA